MFPHKEILSKEQIELLPLVKRFNSNFGLVGGTAVAFYIGHRESIDFDLFTGTKFVNANIRRMITNAHGYKIENTITNIKGQYTITVNKVKFTFFEYPFKIEFTEKFDYIIKMPNLLTLAAMKAYALGRRAKWKDYVDFYFIMKDFHPITDITNKAQEIFENEFNEKIFRASLSYFEDIDYTEEIIYMPGFETDNEIIKKKLIDFSLNF